MIINFKVDNSSYAYKSTKKISISGKKIYNFIENCVDLILFVDFEGRIV